MRRFVIEHPTLTFVLAFVFLVIFPIAIYKTIKSAGAQELKANRGELCVEKNVPAYEAYYYGDDYTHTTYYKEYSPTYTYRNNDDTRYERNYYVEPIRARGPAAWDTYGPAWGSGSYYSGTQTGPAPYPGSAREHGPPAW